MNYAFNFISWPLSFPPNLFPSFFSHPKKVQQSVSSVCCTLARGQQTGKYIYISTVLSFGQPILRFACFSSMFLLSCESQDVQSSSFCTSFLFFRVISLHFLWTTTHFPKQNRSCVSRSKCWCYYCYVLCTIMIIIYAHAYLSMLRHYNHYLFSCLCVNVM